MDWVREGYKGHSTNYLARVATTMADPNDDIVLDGQGLIDHLIDAGVIDGADDPLELADGFHNDWRREIEHVRRGDNAEMALAETFDIDPSALTFTENDKGQFVVQHGDEAVGPWPSQAAFVADLALKPLLSERVPLWDRLDGLSRGELLARLRGFLEVCPACDGTLDVDEQVDEATGQTTIRIRCDDCEQLVVDGTFL